MDNRFLNQDCIVTFSEQLYLQEKSAATREKYLRDVRAFLRFVGCLPITKTLVLEWKNALLQKGYAARSINLNNGKQRGIATGPIFVTQTGKPLNRSNI